MESDDEFNQFVMNDLIDPSSSDDENDMFFDAAHVIVDGLVNHPGRIGSVEGHAVVHRDRLLHHALLYKDYFSDNPTFNSKTFRRRFRMRRPVFLRIMNAVEEHDNYFVQKRNAAGVLGLSSLQKVVAAFRMLAYGVPADALDEYIRIGESTALEALRKFVVAVVEVFGPEYMRLPNEQDTARLLAIGASRGFPGMLAEGEGPQVKYNINGHDYSMGYYLADGIYPSWATFVKTIPEPQGNKKKYFAKAQEACRKDVERAFGVLQSRFAIVRGPARLWDEDTLHDIMMACIILHNMIVEDERDEYGGEQVYNFDDMGQYLCNYDDMGQRVTVSHNSSPELDAFIQKYKNIKNKETHYQLKADLIEHLWQNHSELYKID
ncbi:uncharacterized protein [Zea mays]|uniref:uncharacterized protein n=1 Tax=Zea mays TaxID=4577 RepID=UPI0009AA7860|nr:uncharacterized protein LOC103639956 [Zea mays]|eukprot:XP_020400181.1 uncharacterized protein LOC103639956 [Zea mays]